MEEFAYINLNKVKELFKKLSSSEFKLLLMILYYLSSNNTSVYPNTKKTRDYLSSMGFDKTEARISSLLTSLKGKGILRRECKGAYTVVGNLFTPIDKVIK